VNAYKVDLKASTIFFERAGSRAQEALCLTQAPQAMAKIALARQASVIRWHLPGTLPLDCTTTVYWCRVSTVYNEQEFDRFTPVENRIFVVVKDGVLL
jgi:hypothetical protein